MKRRYPQRPIPGVGVVILLGGEALLVQRGAEPNVGRWSIPGGVIEVGEDLFSAARREVMEECNIQVEIHDIVSVFDLIKKDEQGIVEYHYVLIDVLGTHLDGMPRAGGDILDCRWVKLSEMGKYDVTETAMKAIEEARKMCR